MYVVLIKGISYTRGGIRIMNGEKMKVDEKTAIELLNTGRFKQESEIGEEVVANSVKQEKEMISGKKNVQRTRKEAKEQKQETVPAYE